MTATRALWQREVLAEAGQYDLVVFDEASQLGRCVGAALAPLAKATLFAGDPRQLAPIVRSNDAEVREWLGTSPFDLRRQTSFTVQLNEQSRMHAAVCAVVSNLFYGGDLVVASRERASAAWKAERRVRTVSSLPGRRRLVVQKVSTPGRWDLRIKSYERAESARWCASVVADLVAAGRPEDEVLVLTPYRAQRVRIREALRRVRIRQVQVSTVHGAQGGESHTVFFDATKADSEFLRGPDAWRLVNVALSRAKARLIVAMSDWDRTTPLFDLLGYMLEHGKRPISYEKLARRSDWPVGAAGSWIRLWGEDDRSQQTRYMVGKVRSVLDPHVVEVQDALTGEVVEFTSARLRNRARRPR